MAPIFTAPIGLAGADTKGETPPDRALSSGRVMTEPLERTVKQVGLSPAEFELLRGVPLFAGVREVQWPALLRLMSIRSYPRNHVLFVQGEPAHHLYIVLEGWVRIYRSLPEGDEATVSLFTRGESLAEAAIFEAGGYPVTGAATEESRLLLISGSGLRRALVDDPRLMMNMMASMASKLQYLVKRLAQLSHRTTKQRVAAFLLSLAEKQNASTIRLPLDKRLIAARLGMQPESFSRALAKLANDGVHKEGQALHLTDIARLHRVVQND